MDERTDRSRALATRGHRRRLLAGGLALAIVASGCDGPARATAPVEAAPTSAPSVAAMSPTPSPTPTPPPDPSTWPLAWSDEFDGPPGARPDASIWAYDLGDGSAAGIEGWGNRELEYYTDDARNVALDGEGNLVITVLPDDGSRSCWYGPCTFTSARLLTRDRLEIQYGRIEARIRVPDGWGLWPAFWMLGADIGAVGWPNSGEIDIMEFVGRRPTTVLGTIHGPGYSGSSGVTAEIELDEPVSAAFHTFAIEWWPGHIAWFLDGVKYHEVSPADVAPNTWVFEHPFFLILNVAVGGNLGGPIDPSMTFPQSMVVDSVRVYQASQP